MGRSFLSLAVLGSLLVFVISPPTAALDLWACKMSLGNG